MGTASQCFTHDENRGVDFLRVYDATKMEPTARILVPCRVPYGFHSHFVRSDQLEHVNAAPATP